jgi:hypothetical protein
VGKIGPGVYNPSMSSFKKGGWSIGKDKRKGFIKNGDIPGAGTYNPKCNCNCDNKGFSFGRSGRKAKVSTTPGFYKIPASVPDVPKYLLPEMSKRKIHI